MLQSWEAISFQPVAVSWLEEVVVGKWRGELAGMESVWRGGGGYGLMQQKKREVVWCWGGWFNQKWPSSLKRVLNSLLWAGVSGYNITILRDLLLFVSLGLVLFVVVLVDFGVFFSLFGSSWFGGFLFPLFFFFSYLGDLLKHFLLKIFRVVS